ncbi:DNA topoisomerase I [Candidatus Woesearchaeota archaeon]|nr:DNA topoisomerase I [Candidatus Woesearchaeota archaeon]
MYELIITEKPKASLKIATALADTKVIKKSDSGVPYYELNHGKKDIVVACAVGHLYGLAEKGKDTYKFPVFDVEWVPTSQLSKTSKFTAKYLSTLKKLSKEAKEFTVATDFDIEGEVIGVNALRYACSQKDASRMKFSTLTKPDLVNAYENKSKTIEWGQANAGLTRHELDWYYGINFSRALTQAIKSGGLFKILSIGRVQGPALKIIVDRENEIQNFKPTPYWQIQLLGILQEQDIEAGHINDKFWKKEEADAVVGKTKGRDATVKNVEKNEFEQKPPYPFDLTSLQIEAFRVFKIQPKETLAIAQNLYVSSYISYPRTSSQKLPPTIGYKRIIESLAKNENYEKLANGLLAQEKLYPNQGPKTDEAHPAIYPTGVQPKKISGSSKNIYDLIVKRFLATFGKPALREKTKLTLDCNTEIFIAEATRTTEEGWHVLYQPYLSMEEKILPKAKEGDTVKVKEIKMLEKQTEPPRRFNAASIIRELEKRNLGTKATRAQIVDTLFRRGYVQGPQITANELGIKTVETLINYCPEILDEELTRHFEIEMEDIRHDTKKSEEVLEEAKCVITEILGKFKKQEKEIGEGLHEAQRESELATQVGTCPKCKQPLIIRRGRFGRYIACIKHPECNTTMKLPRSGMIKQSKEKCDSCGSETILVINKGKPPVTLCVNPDCPKKKQEQKELDSYPKKECPKCKSEMVVRQGPYGRFYGCSKFPKCRHIEKINEN